MKLLIISVDSYNLLDSKDPKNFQVLGTFHVVCNFYDFKKYLFAYITGKKMYTKYDMTYK